MNDLIRISENESISVTQICEISDIVEISNQWRKMFCFTIVLQDEQIYNIAREYENGNRQITQQEISCLHQAIIDTYQSVCNKKCIDKPK
ncbi:MAG: hypothetical protein K9N06_00255 [Candidatus Cloacimonetes bacterium]|nr:hypothetical protein [Candidatus Cloacimonadota bacterium]